MMTGVALFTAEACSGEGDRPPAVTDVGYTPIPGAGGRFGSASDRAPGSGGGSEGVTGEGGGRGDVAPGATASSGGTSSGGTSEVNPGEGLIPQPTDEIPAIDGG